MFVFITPNNIFYDVVYRFSTWFDDWSKSRKKKKKKPTQWRRLREPAQWYSIILFRNDRRVGNNIIIFNIPKCRAERSDLCELNAWHVISGKSGQNANDRSDDISSRGPAAQKRPSSRPLIGLCVIIPIV